MVLLSSTTKTRTPSSAPPLSGTMLAEGDGGKRSSTINVEPTPSVLPINLEQEEAVCAAMACELTVVTGPPGTGKSQVLANAVATALASNESVLLASKNNYAIDVVAERVRRAHPDAVVMRLGRQTLLSQAVSTLGDAIHRPLSAGPSLHEASIEWANVKGTTGGGNRRKHRFVVRRAS